MKAHLTKMEQQTEKKQEKSWYDKWYKLMLVIPLIIIILSLIYLVSFYIKTGEFINKDVSLSGGTTITLQGEFDSAKLESALKQKFPDVSVRKLTDITTGSSIALIIESSAEPEQLKQEIESVLGYKLTDENLSIEFSGPSLSENFYKQLITALVISFILMSIVIFIMFRTFVPSIAVIFAAFADIILPLAILNFFNVKISAAGIAAFLMLIGYSVDTDILLTTRAIKRKDKTLNNRIYRAFKTGIIMSLTSLAAVLPVFFIVTGLPDSFRQIFLIIALGLCADIFNTWLTNASIIKWYCEKKGIK